MNKPITIVVASNNNFAILISTLIRSIDINHTSSEPIDIYIIDDGISKRARSSLESMVFTSKVFLHWFNSSIIVPSHIKLPLDNTSFPLTAYMRIFAPYIVEASLEKILYLDVDTILQQDIATLWNISLENYIVGAVQDYGKIVSCSWSGIPNYQELGIPKDTKYFNSGVLLMNPKKWRENKITEQIIEITLKNRKHVRFADQYGLNVVFANRWLEINPIWNWYAFQKNEDAFPKPGIIHFTGIKPLYKSYNAQEIYKDEFFRYLAMTPWKNFKPLSGNHIYIKKILNKLKKIVMMLRS